MQEARETHTNAEAKGALVLMTLSLMRIAQLFAVLFGLLSGPVLAQSLDRSDVEKIIREYLVENPEIIAEAMTELERRQTEAEEQARAQALADSADILFDSTRQVVMGNPNGSVTLVEFFDYNCGYCKRAYADKMRLIEEDPDLRLVLKEFPVLGQGSVEAAVVAIAVNEVAPEKYAEFHENLLLSRGQANSQSALRVVESLGIDLEAVQASMSSDEPGHVIEEVYTIANRLGLTGTPSYVVGDEVVFGAVGYDQLRSKLTELRSCGETTC